MMPAPEAIVIGASAGAVEALSRLLPPLPASFPLPILIVVHLPADKKSVMADLFRAKCHMQVHEAEDKQAIEPGTIYFAPSDYHILVEKNGTISLSSEEPVLFSRPSIDILFETAADAYGETLIGIILTGANNDGAEGLRAVMASGGQALVQSPALAHARYMPEFALKACPTAQSMSIEGMVSYLQDITRKVLTQ